MELAEYLTEIIMTAILVVGGFIWNNVREYFKEKWNLDFSKFLDEDGIVTALKAGKRHARKKLGVAVDDARFESEVLNFAMSWLNAEFPNQLKKYNATPEQLKKWLEAKFDDA